MIETSQKLKLCLTTVDSSTAAQKIAKEILQQKLVACVNIINQISSMYHWQGQIVEDAEFLLIMKTSSQKVAELESTLLDLHPYELPEFIVLDINSGSSDYLNWISAAVK